MPSSIKRNSVYTALGSGGSAAIVSKHKTHGYAIRYYELNTRGNWEYFNTSYRKSLSAAKALARREVGR